jgi:hypothetical protein
MHSRYENRPFLRLLECYILDSIGMLPDENRQKLETMSPKLIEIYGCSGVWSEIVEQSMHFPKDMRDKINEVWEKNKLIAKKSGQNLEPEYFAQLFADENFSE